MASHEAWHRRARLSPPRHQPNAQTRLHVNQYLARLPAAVVGRRFGESLFHPAPGWWRYSLGPYLTAIANLDLNPTSVLDVGCGDGLVTCFYAFLYPEAEVVALDECKLCLITTRTIASRLGLTNLRIVQGDATNLASLFPGQTFALVFARALVARRIQCSCGRFLGDQPDDAPPKAKVTQIVEAIRHVLAPGAGQLVSTEGWQGAADLWCWASTLAAAGFGIDWIRSRSVPTGRHSWLMLVAQAIESPTETGLSDIIAFLVGTEFQQTGNAPTVTGYMAEALLQVLATHGLIFGFQATRHAFVIRRELHRAGTLLVSYDYTNGNERELRLWPTRFAAHLKSQLETEATDLQAQQWDVLRFIPSGDRPDAHEGPDTP